MQNSQGRLTFGFVEYNMFRRNKYPPSFWTGGKYWSVLTESISNQIK